MGRKADLSPTNRNYVGGRHFSEGGYEKIATKLFKVSQKTDPGRV